MPYFDGGIGFNSQESIFENLGFNTKKVSNNEGDMVAAYIEKIK